MNAPLFSFFAHFFQAFNYFFIGWCLQKHPFKVVLESTSQVEGSSSFPTVWKFQKFSAVQILREISLVSFMVCQKWYISLAKLIPRKIRVIGKFLSLFTHCISHWHLKVKYLHTSAWSGLKFLGLGRAQTQKFRARA